ncbi:MAG: hypothetical protein NTV92_03385, partial [Candidatus Bipolaricaulota bacterium]|nr:hypothetical protein [Candidatus Bipolaricaulota bacterium]
MRRHRRFAIACTLVLVCVGLASAQAGTPDQANATIDSRVLKIIDGDTVDIRGSTRVRYLNIDTPEIGQPYADAATALNKSLVQFKNVRLELDVQAHDVYDRL